MDYLLEETVPPAELKKFETRYNEEMTNTGKVASTTQFEYAWCLVRSKYPADIRKGLLLLEDLFKVTRRLATGRSLTATRDLIYFQNRDESGKRDYLYYLAIGNARIKEYQTSLKYIRALLQVQPGNRQAADLEAIVKKKMEREGLLGMAMVGGATVAFGAVVGLGVLLAKGAKK